MDPATGVRDLDIPRGLARHFGHGEMGVYAELRGDGEVAVGDGLGAPMNARSPLPIMPRGHGVPVGRGCTDWRSTSGQSILVSVRRGRACAGAWTSAIKASTAAWPIS
jgi:hypothetical protein